MPRATSPLRSLFFALALLALGLAAGLAISARVAEPDAPPRVPARDAAASLAPPPLSEASAAQAAPAPAAGPDFTRVAAQTVRAVANISSIQRTRRPSSPFDNDPFFRYFFGDDAADML